MKYLVYISLALTLTIISNRAISQNQNDIIKENLSYATGIIDDKVIPEGLDILAALNDGGDIIIEFESETVGEIFNLRIYDVTGKLIVSENFINNSNHNKIFVPSSISSKGIYIISLNNQKDKSVKKFYL